MFLICIVAQYVPKWATADALNCGSALTTTWDCYPKQLLSRQELRMEVQVPESRNSRSGHGSSLPIVVLLFTSLQKKIRHAIQ